ncbi:MAG: glycerol-3-phosphate 1-O-acyltransferase PlsB [Deltaproteobacteria bacterium]|nr:glycerol-3-phosphate 1-O-acyltransferase PlsB [Deltaproteobacteria bacterium]
MNRPQNVAAEKESLQVPSMLNSWWKQVFSWVESFLYLWVRSKPFPKRADDLKLHPDAPICYVMNSRSFTDLFVLDHHCREMDLPRPLNHLAELTAGEGAYLYLAKAGLFQKKRGKDLPQALLNLVESVELKKQDVQVIPVSVFWGRNPGKEEQSLFKLLFFDDEHGGWLQRFIKFFVQGRNVFCNFGQPISIKELVAEQPDLISVAKKLRRVLRVHFHRQRDVVIGPYVYDRRQVMRNVVQSKTVREFIDKESEKKGKSKEKLELQAYKYANEIAANQSPYIIRFFDILLTWIFNRIYKGVEVRNGGDIRELALTHEIVYLPCHKSHMDYLLIGYVLYHLGVRVPHTAAGVNLNFWPIGALFRRAGAFFIRRSFAGNRLYSTVFSEYVHYLLASHHPLGFYIEGGRSRTGRLLSPKLGMLVMVIRSIQRRQERPVLLIPLYIGYDKLMEARSYIHELRGKTKKGESIWQLLRAGKILRTEFGKAYINFGKPIELTSILSQEANMEGSKAVIPLAKEVMRRINGAIYLSPVSLLSVAMIALPRKAIPEQDLINIIDLWAKLLHEVPYSDRFYFPEKTAKEFLKDAEKITYLKRFQHPSGDVIHVSEKDCAFLSYYRNSVLPVFVLPSLIASFVIQNRVISLEDLKLGCAGYYQLLKDEFYLHWSESEIVKAVDHYLKTFLALGLLVPQQNGSHYACPDLASEQYLALRTLGFVVGGTLQRYRLYALLLSQYKQGLTVEHDEFSKTCRLASQRVSILNGDAEIEYFDKTEFDHFIESMHNLGYIATADNVITVKEELQELTETLTIIGEERVQDPSKLKFLKKDEL